MAVRRVRKGGSAGLHGDHAAVDRRVRAVIESSCPFCSINPEQCIFDDDIVFAMWDAYPVSPGHALVVTRRHIARLFEATPAERAALLDGAAATKTIIEREHKPDGYNVGINVGDAAGQTIGHLHLHVIPRYTGDVPDPRGGVRFVIPGKAAYPFRSDDPQSWIGKAPHGRSLVSGGSEDPLLPHLVAHLDSATEVDVAVAFTLDSGVSLLQPHLRDVLSRGGRVRIVTGDYLGVTEPDALLHLMDLEGAVELRIFESAGKSFHPKAYIIAAHGDECTSFVGSSNLSATALREGVEWNQRVITARDRQGVGEVRNGFDALFNHPKTKPLTADWIDAYRRRRQQAVIVPSGQQPETPPPPPEPHSIQREALAQLAATRQLGNRAGLVVLATGLGKTWLSAFDSHSPDFGRILFVAHREEILTQAIDTYRRIRPSATIGRYAGGEHAIGVDILFASIQTLSRQRHLDRFARDEFDYIVVDEFHHASAATYRRLIDHFTPRFLLGLTATPERTDGGDLLALCGENLVYRCDLVDGIRRGLLSPFDYYGVPDDVDYSNIPWRSSRFDEEELTNALATTARADNALDQLRKRGGKRTLAFCVSQRHANFMARHFTSRGVRSVAVHSGPDTAPRAHSLEQLESGALDVVFAVDMFNEGVDLPHVDTVMMLRPTESQILWLQQFGRGLRRLEGKTLIVIDYIGNHRSFLIKARTLLQLGSGDAEVAFALKQLDEGTFELPPGCTITYDLEAKDILLGLLRGAGRGDALRQYYLDFVDRHGARPTAVEAFSDGHDPKAARPAHSSWLAFVRAQNGMTGEQTSAFESATPFLESLETTPMTKSYKMIVLLAMMHDGSFPGEIGIERLTMQFAEMARRYALVRAEVGEALDDPHALRGLIEENPVEAWVGGRGTAGESYFEYTDGVFRTRFALRSTAVSGLEDLAREIVEWRLAVYLRRVGPEGGADRIACKLSHASGKPILFYSPGRDQVGGIPEGWRDVTIDGESYQANFVKIAVNVVVRTGETENRLPEILRRWFGPEAGLPGTDHSVVFRRISGGYKLEPLDSVKRDARPELWQPYTRAQIAERFGFEFRGREAQQGIVQRPGLILLFVTLDKEDMVQEHRYRDQFLSSTEFQWQTQNRTARDSNLARLLQRHVEAGVNVRLCVRKRATDRGRTLPFIYCGELTFQRWEGDRPITVWWNLGEPVPSSLRAQLGLAGD
jgi:superfamily II DNA or RNA helicase/diadenosine tetraphosphate (Ap4A) HIT family hydrolase